MKKKELKINNLGISLFFLYFIYNKIFKYYVNNIVKITFCSSGSSSGSPGARAGRRSSLALTPEDEPLVDVAVSTQVQLHRILIFILF